MRATFRFSEDLPNLQVAYRDHSNSHIDNPSLLRVPLAPVTKGQDSPDVCLFARGLFNVEMNST